MKLANHAEFQPNCWACYTATCLKGELESDPTLGGPYSFDAVHGFAAITTANGTNLFATAWEFFDVYEGEWNSINEYQLHLAVVYAHDNELDDIVDVKGLGRRLYEESSRVHLPSGRGGIHVYRMGYSETDEPFKFNDSGVYPICPLCRGLIPNNETPGAYPGALSRVDSKTEICSECGVREARIVAFHHYQKER
jgi:hypothetical protein